MPLYPPTPKIDSDSYSTDTKEKSLEVSSEVAKPKKEKKSKVVK